MTTHPLLRSLYGWALCLAVGSALAPIGCGTDVDLGSRDSAGQGGTSAAPTDEGGTGVRASGSSGIAGAEPQISEETAGTGGNIRPEAGSGGRTVTIAVGGSTSTEGGAAGASDGPAPPH